MPRRDRACARAQAIAGKLGMALLVTRDCTSTATAMSDHAPSSPKLPAALGVAPGAAALSQTERGKEQ